MLLGRLSLDSGDCQTPLWPRKGLVSAPLSAGLKACDNCTLQLLLAINSRQELPGSQHPRSFAQPNMSDTAHGWRWQRLFGVLLLHKDTLEHCGSPWVTLSTLSSHRCASSAHRALPFHHSLHVCTGWHVGSRSSSKHSHCTAPTPGERSKLWLWRDLLIHWIGAQSCSFTWEMHPA